MLMQLNTVLEVDHVSKIYSREQISTRQRLATTFTRALMGRPSRPPKKLKSGEFWSLEDISFTLKRGEALGVIGLNGAGKTTLLRTLASQLLPDKGEIRILGDAVAMIDLTAGFQMSASGSRNIHLRGAMLGRSKEDIEATYDEILNFAELGDAINAPVSTYSSGMLMRLAFSIMVMAKPDVLLIDEILSVGDFAFRQKCLARIREMRAHAAFVFVSHSMGNIRLFCDRVIVLNKGKVVFTGDPEEAISVYEGMKFPEISPTEKRNKILKPQFHSADLVKDVRHFWCDSDGQKIIEIKSGDSLYFNTSFIVNYVPKNLILGIPVWSEDGVYVTGFSTELQEKKITLDKAGKKYFFKLKVPNIGFNTGNYISNFAIHDGLECLFRKENNTISVFPSIHRHWGIVSLPHEWKIITNGEKNEKK
jgi:ABC-type polysaccharide/polyol phosphate transport system ATPase subunit